MAAFAYGIVDSKINPCFKAISLASCHKGSICTSHIGQVRMKEMPQMYLHGPDVPANALQGQQHEPCSSLNSLLVSHSNIIIQP